MNTSWTRRPAAEHGQAVRRLAAFVFAALLVAAALPAHAFQKTLFADGSFEYFFAAPSLDIRGTGDLDLTGLSFIEGIESGFRVGALFDLDWLDGERAWLASPASTWSGIDILPRTLSIVAGGNLDLGSARLSFYGGSISLTSSGTLTIGDGSVIDVGGSGAIALLTGRDIVAPHEPIIVTGPAPIPEPSTAAFLLVGLAGLAGVFGRRARAGR